MHSGFGVDRDGDGGSGPVHLSRFEAEWGVRQPDLHASEAVRTDLLQQLQSLGDFRPGSIGAQVGRCSRPTCHCARLNDAGHDLRFRRTPMVAGKTVTESFPTPSALRKAQREVTEFHRLQPSAPNSPASTRISADSVRPSQNRVAGRRRKKTAVAIHPEVAWEVDSLLQRIFADRRRTGSLDLEAVEMAFRTAMSEAGAAGLLLTGEVPQQRHIPCACGQTAG